MNILKYIFSFIFKNQYLDQGHVDLTDNDSNISPEILSLARNLDKLLKGNKDLINMQMFDEEEPNIKEETRYQKAEAISMAIYPKYKFSEYGRIFLDDEDFLNYYQKFMDANNWHSLDRKYTLNQLLKLCVHLRGDVAECGTYKGASAYLMCKKFNATDKIIHLFDSYQGLSEPDVIDGEYWSKGSLESTEDELVISLKEFNNYRVYKGWIPDKFREVSDLVFSFLHIDVDLHYPTLESLRFFYTRMVKGSVILLDDYGFSTCPGAKAAVDSFFYDKPEELILLPTGQAFVMIL